MTNPCRLPVKPRFLASLLERALGLHTLGKIYDETPRGLDPFQFLDHTLDALGVNIQIENPELLEDIPKTGPVSKSPIFTNKNWEAEDETFYSLHHIKFTSNNTCIFTI